MAIMLKIRWDMKDGAEPDFKANQEKLCAVMLEHPGVITYHAEYPAPGVSEWTEIYANDAAFKAHLDNEKGKAPLGAVIEACEKITCRCFGDPSDESKGTRPVSGQPTKRPLRRRSCSTPCADKDSSV